MKAQCLKSIPKTTIAIIGCGAAAVTFLRSLCDFSKKEKILNLQIIIFSDAEKLGVGLAYQNDCDNLLVNRPVDQMSANVNDQKEFSKWLLRKKLISAIPKQPLYLSRHLFGEYLKDILNNTLIAAEKQGITINIFSGKVNSITYNQTITIHCNNLSTINIDYVILCIGNNTPEDIYQLKDTPHYIPSPYPLNQHLLSISTTEKVGIIGNSLTAIDIALALQQLSHRGEIKMLSRQAVFPKVRGKTSVFKLKFLTKHNLYKIYQKKGPLSLCDVLRLLRKELNAIDYSWKFLFSKIISENKLETALKNEIQASLTERKWQSLLIATNQIIELCWHLLAPRAKQCFMNYFHRYWQAHRTPIPPENAKKLLQMVKSHQLDMIGEIQQITYQNKQYKVSLKSGAIQYYDWIINACGPNKQIRADNALPHFLVKTGLAREHAFGGLEVDFMSGSLIAADGKINPKLRVIGHNTVGTYYHTSSLEMIAIKSHKMAKDIGRILKKDLKNGK